MKRNIISYLLPMALMLFCLVSCEKEYMLYDDLTAPNALKAPADDSYVKIEPSSESTLDLSWEPGVAKDGGLVLYEVLFDNEGGDFTQPIFMTLSDNKGASPQLSLPHKILNKIASAAGIEALATGKVKWTVVASKGTNVAKTDMYRTLTLERPMGFAEVPGELYITGSATEGGAELSIALPLKQVEDGVFEIYTSLQPGTYQLVTSKDESAKKYYIENSLIKEGDAGTTVEDTDKVYRLTFDFNSATSQAVEIQSIDIFMSAYNTSIGTLQYAGNSTWVADQVPVEFYQFSWGRDERYKFMITTADGVEYWGSQNVNNVSPVGADPSYFYLFPVSSAQWDNTYKFDPAADNNNVKVEAFFDPMGNYTHKVTTL
jgi:hypothetical protein